MTSVINSDCPRDLQKQVSICDTTSTLFEIELSFSHLFFLASEFNLNSYSPQNGQTDVKSPATFAARFLMLV